MSPQSAGAPLRPVTGSPSLPFSWTHFPTTFIPPSDSALPASFPHFFKQKTKMCRLLAGIMRTRRILAPRVTAMNQRRATLIHGKPAKDPVGVLVSCCGSSNVTPAPGFMSDVIEYSPSIEAKENLFLFQETVFVLTVMTVTLLGPSGYILSQLDHYKARD